MHPMTEFITEGLIPLAVTFLAFATVIAIIVIVTRFRQRRYELQAEVQGKLIEKFGSAPELVEFLHSKAGREFVTGVQTGTRALAHDRVVFGLRRSIVLSALGLGFVALWLVTGKEGLSFPGIILLALGLGYFAASMVSLKFSQQLGVPPTPPSASGSDVNV